MALEAGDGFISGLVASNPVGATDPKSQGDDHIRLIKTALKGTFPNLTGAITPTQTELNYVDGVTSAIQTQLDAKAASSHAHSAADLTSGTIPDARFPATLPAASGVNLTALNASNIASGSLADARLSSNVPLKDASNVFTGDLRTSNTDPIFWLRKTDAGSDEQYTLLRHIGTAFRITFFDDAISGSVSPLVITRSGTAATDFAISATALTFTGAVSTPGTSAAEVGYSGTPQNEQNGNYTLVLGDRGKVIYKSSGGAGETLTIPANASVAFPVGTIIRGINRGGGTWTVAITSDTLEQAGSGSLGSRTIADKGLFVLEKVASTVWVISGVGVS